MSFAWSSLPSSVRRVPAELPQTLPVRTLARQFTRGRLRVLAFHGVPDVYKFERLVDAILQRYTPIDGDGAVRALAGEDELPPFPIWFTFDDGEPSTFGAGSLLAKKGIRATAFVCPGVIDTDRRLWFQTVSAAHREGLVRPGEEQRFSVRRLKGLRDDMRRREVEVLDHRLGGSTPVRATQADTAMLRAWIGSGHEVGNHTWDHPCLDQCVAEEQVDQVRRAHEWLAARDVPVRFFAYPNGNWAEASAHEARRLGYSASLLFDHRLARARASNDRVSRLRLDADASVRRALGVAAGAHSSLFHLVNGERSDRG